MGVGVGVRVCILFIGYYDNKCTKQQTYLLKAFARLTKCVNVAYT